MKFVFVDTVGLLALWDQDDQWHDAAEAAWRGVVAAGAVPYTTPFVLLECGNAASRRPYRAAVDPIRQQFEQANTLIWPTDEEWIGAWETYRKLKPGAAGIVDQLSFLVMTRLGITDAFTNDRHFKAAGFNTLF
jgi:predicted nucleic acid-binding protein